MHSLIAWIKRNKLATFLIVVIALMLLTQSRNQINTFSQTSSYDTGYSGASGGVAMMGLTKSAVAPAMMDRVGISEAAPAPDVTNRMVVTNSYLSLVVKNVSESVSAVKAYVQSLGGYMVNSNISRPEEGGTGTITVRIPADKLDSALAQLKDQSVKVVSENLDGQDVTDQYVDNDARLAILEQNKARFEQIMTSATKVTDILAVQNEIFSLQSQIDSIKGQQKYLEQTSKMALVTVYLSTDELALPYAPVNVWRPEVIFKLAVRGLMGTLQNLGTLLIWVAVYAVIWLPILLIVLFVVKKKHQNKQ